MSHAVATPILWEVRCYDTDRGADGSNGYTRRDHWHACCLARATEQEGTVLITLLGGQRFSRASMRDVKDEARRHGVKRLTFERHTRMKDIDL